MVSMKNRSQSWLFCFQKASTYCTMGCNTSSRVTVEGSPPKNPHYDREAQNQAEETASLGTISLISQGQSRNKDGSCQRSLPEVSTEKFSSAKEENNEQITEDIRGGLPKKHVSLLEKKRQTSSDILEELRIQGLIKNQSTTSKNRTADDSMSKERLLKKELLADRPSLINPYEGKTSGNETDCSTSIVKNSSSTIQLLTLNLAVGSWMEKEEIDEYLNNVEDFVVESDVTYNTINEVF
uniref:Stathmin domain-containing protein 1 isoform X1 n=1 Tax=Pogona vitticeps TaxID=103695 RepID=A0A6J0VB71_9SAUR